MRPTTSVVGAPVSLSPSALYTGSGWVLLAAVVWAAGSLYAKRADRPSSAVLNIGAQMLVGGALVGFSAYVWVLGAASPALVGTYAFVNPGVAVFLGWAFVGETVTPTTSWAWPSSSRRSR